MFTMLTNVIVLIFLGLVSLLDGAAPIKEKTGHPDIRELPIRPKTPKLPDEIKRSDRSSASPGVVYTRWGRTTCPRSNNLIYTGIAGGAHHRNPGSGANYLCLPKYPEWGTVRNGNQHCGAQLYGAEYEMCSQGDVYSRTNSHDRRIDDQDVPCSVCQARGRQSHVMMPAKVNCPRGWIKEYQGFIVAANLQHHRSEWVCMDMAPEALAGGHTNHNGALFHMAEVRCGALPCPPYHTGHELSCVVCTQ